jgi:catechol 2,3-dioxygenase-like lactoylglutathione lyase family enzyme
MYDHIGLKVRNLDASARFYKAALAPLGFVPDSSGTGFGPPDAPALWLYQAEGSGGIEGGGAPRQPPNGGTHVALRAANRAAVDRFHEEGLAAGARDHGPPGLRLDYGPTYYAAFLLDPDGNNVEAVYLG